MDFLPVTKKEAIERGWNEVDFVCVTGDCYIDHPSFGIAIISRVLEARGYKVAIIAQPNWKDINSFKIFGKPRLGFLVTGGNIDSMVNNYTVALKKRAKDLYSEDGKAGKRPDRATIVYSKKIREAYPDTAIILGGLEAGLRRFAHYDYWDNKVMRSLLLDSEADLIAYGMGELTIAEIAEALQSGLPIEEITFIKGTVYKTKDKSRIYDYIELPTFKEICSSKTKFAKSFMIQYENTDHITASTLVEDYGNIYVVQNTPQRPMTTGELDSTYALKYMRDVHTMYKKPVPAIQEVKFSIISNRGCFGSCNFCALTFHQGRTVQSRSHESILREAEGFIWDSDFKGYIHDVGGPTANFRENSCDKQLKDGVCKSKLCLYPQPCKNLKISHSDYLKLLRKLRAIPNVKKVFVRSGIRYDYLIHDKDNTFFEELCEHHISGQLKVAPEHISDNVLKYMGKPSKEIYDLFSKKYFAINTKLKRKQFLVPYLMSSHPGSKLSDAIELAEYLHQNKISPEQVQDFYPTPATLSTCMYYTEIDPRTMKPVYVAKSMQEKAMQRALIQYRLPQNYTLVHKALIKAGRNDLIGFASKCLIRPRQSTKFKGDTSKKKF